jgi:hypothetical protein
MISAHATDPRIPRSTTATLLVVVALFLFPGRASAIFDRTLIAPKGEATSSFFGHQVATAGDVNGDGYPDLVVGAPDYNGGQGRAYVYYGGPGMDEVADLAMTGGTVPFPSRLGYSVSTAGDVNGDGYADVLVGGRELAYVYFGGPNADAVADWTMAGDGVVDGFGSDVDTAGDVNGDGYADVVVGTFDFDGRAYFFFGGPNPDSVPDLTLAGESPGGAFGQRVSTAGDVNGDGFDDFMVAAWAYSFDRGRVYVYHGGRFMDGVADWTLTGEASSDGLGSSLAEAGDVNGDGYGDVILGAPGYTGSNLYQGRAVVFYGGPAADTQPDLTMIGEGQGDNFGQAVGSAGDVNADGYSDLIVGSIMNDFSGRAYVYFGGPAPDGVAELTMFGEDLGYMLTSFGSFVGTAGDVNGDGRADVLVAAEGYDNARGRIYVRSIDTYEVVSPNGGEQWVTAQGSVVRWRGDDPADLAISYDGGSSWSTLAVGIGGAENNQLLVTVPSTETVHAKVRVSQSGQPVSQWTSDMSDGVFRIVKAARAPAAAHRLHITPTGNAASQNFGVSVSAAGDVNGDGYADVIVGASGYNNYQGRATVYHGGPQADQVADWTLTGEGPFQYFGISVGGAGDVNGDGYPDVIVGAQEYAGSQGRAYVYYGGPGADAVADLTLSGVVSGNYFGCSVGAAGDVNGDGYADVLVGAFGVSSNQGRAYVFHGGPGADATPDRTLNGGSGDIYFGSSVSTAGDVNGDGYADVIVGAYGYQSSRGHAYVFLGGPGADAVADLTLTGEAAGHYFGTSVGTAGDVNGDGYADVIVGANGYDGGRGRAYVYHGGPGADALADLTLTGGSTSSFGTSVGTAGDVNGDGYADVIVGGWMSLGAKGSASVYYGGPAGDAIADHTLSGEASSNFFGMSVGAAGDVSGDGYADVIVGAYGYSGSQGRAYVYDFNRYFINAPNGGETWNVGATKTIAWLGAEKADVWMSVDAGRTYDRLGTGLGGAENNSWSLRVPHSPGKFTMVKVTPSDEGIGGSDRSDSLFTIQTSVALLALMVAPLPDRAGAAMLTWNTDPGPDDLAGYRLEKAAAGASWQTLVSLTRENSFTDESAGAGGSRYRLFAVNGFGEELMLGETALRPMKPIAAWPLPYRGGSLNLSFATANGLGGGPAHAEVSIFDVSGRLVRTVARGSFGAGYHSAGWDGRNGDGQKVAAGIYFIRVRSAEQETSLKLVVIR